LPEGNEFCILRGEAEIEAAASARAVRPAGSAS
jgi:hypothetical protein